MNRYSLHDTFVIHQYPSDTWEEETQNEDYFKIIFVEEGLGSHTVNGTKFLYKENNIFLLAPNDTHSFEIEKQSKFTYFKFTDRLFSSKVSLPPRKYWLQRIEQLLHNPNLIAGDIIYHEEDRNITWNLHKIILKEFKKEKVYYHEIICNAVSTLLSIFVRNLSEKNTVMHLNTPIAYNKIDQVIHHIKHSIYDNELTKISYMAQKFQMSQSSISSSFKKATGESIHQYVTKYKMELVEYRLQHTEFTIAEIADQLGYTDESHLTKTFKKYFEISPKQYREKTIQKGVLNSA